MNTGGPARPLEIPRIRSKRRTLAPAASGQTGRQCEGSLPEWGETALAGSRRPDQSPVPTDGMCHTLFLEHFCPYASLIQA